MADKKFTQVRMPDGTLYDLGGGLDATVEGEVLILDSEDHSGSSVITYLDMHEEWIDLDNEPRFEHSNNGKPWSTQTLFTYDGHNMYSASKIGDGGNSIEYLKNISNETMLLKAYYKSSTEGPSYDYGYIDAEGIRVSSTFGGSESGNTSIFSLSPNTTLVFTYRKDGSSTGGLDNVGIALYEVKGEK